MTFYTSVNNVLKRLDDYPAVNSSPVWTRAEIELYVKDGYNIFSRQTKCILDFFYPENIPTPGNYVGWWERDYFESGMIAAGLMGFTGGYWERDYAEAGATGPVNHTQTWEATYLSTEFMLGIQPIPEDNIAVDRATHNWRQLDPEWTAFFQENDKNYQTTPGTASRFAMDQDGISRIRLAPLGDGNATVYDVTGTFGLIRSASDTDGFGTWAPMGTWGTLREVPEHFPMGGPYGIPRRLFSDTDNTRVEYFRLGKSLDEYAFEVADRFVKYVEFYAQAKALERDGPGQDMALSSHFMDRFNEGVGRMISRITDNKRPVVGKIGGTARVNVKPALARLPYRYGRQTRRPY